MRLRYDNALSLSNDTNLMKLSNRLQTLHSLVSNDYQHIWDCCCDHGFLGVQLLSDNKAPQIHFVDIVPSLMNELEGKLTRYFPQDNNVEQHKQSQWTVYCLDVAAISLDKHWQTPRYCWCGWRSDSKSSSTTFIANIQTKISDFCFAQCISNSN